MSGASERANGRASGPVLTSQFLFVPDHSASIAKSYRLIAIFIVVAVDVAIVVVIVAIHGIGSVIVIHAVVIALVNRFQMHSCISIKVMRPFTSVRRSVPPPKVVVKEKIDHEIKFFERRSRIKRQAREQVARMHPISHHFPTCFHINTRLTINKMVEGKKFFLFPMNVVK